MIEDKAIALNSAPKYTAEDISRMIQENDIKIVRVVFNDNVNVSRARNIPAKQFIHSVLRAGVQYPSGMMSVDTSGAFVLSAGEGFTGGYGSWLLKPDLSTFTVLPWARNCARVVADMYTLDGEAIHVAPRHIFRKVLQELDKEGLVAYGAAELEFYVFKEFDTTGYTPSWTGVQCYSEVKQSEVDEILYNLSVPIEKLGIGVEAVNTEYGSGQFEVSIKPFTGLGQADAAFTYKAAVKELMHQLGYHATFMAKPISNQSGSGAHFHHSLYNKYTGANALYDSADQYGMSDTMKHFIAGQLAHSAAICAFANPTINSYRRLRPYTFAPFNITWSFDNRMCLIRVPEARGSGMNMENRIAGADNNPYLMMAAMYAAGLDGIRQSMTLEDPIIHEDAYALQDHGSLPSSLPDALAALKEDDVLQAYLGKEGVQSFIALKENEIQRFNNHVTDWEISEYKDLF
ncbi:MAG: glutamine synthetase family protein [Sporolactobacillus sp.]